MRRSADLGVCGCDTPGTGVEQERPSADHGAVEDPDLQNITPPRVMGHEIAGEVVEVGIVSRREAIKVTIEP
ncbi:MAG: alcohol dehydrogenase catalytic domain-containing protein [Devosia sp.]